jgi:hypothetical protein
MIAGLFVVHLPNSFFAWLAEISFIMHNFQQSAQMPGNLRAA